MPLDGAGNCEYLNDFEDAYSQASLISFGNGQMIYCKTSIMSLLASLVYVTQQSQMIHTLPYNHMYLNRWWRGWRQLQAEFLLLESGGGEVRIGGQLTGDSGKHERQGVRVHQRQSGVGPVQCVPVKLHLFQVS